MGLFPFAVIIIGALILFVAFLFWRLSVNDMTEILLSVGTIWLIVIFVLVFVSFVCASIQVREGFGEITKDDLVALEDQVCALMASSDSYITNDVGKAGQDNPAVLEKAKQDARGSGSGTMPECSMTPAVIEGRISRIERALGVFTGPQLKKTYDKTVPCKEGFESPLSGSPVSPGSFGDRLKKIKEKIATQKKQYLEPIEQKEKDVKAGKLSDCEKKKAANAAVVGSGSMSSLG
jgi:hypothetical protein